jgi:hypothetical protein
MANTAQAALAKLDAVTLADMEALDVEQLRNFRELLHHCHQLTGTEFSKRMPKPGRQPVAAVLRGLHPSNVDCPECNGSGRLPRYGGLRQKLCPQCGGLGWVKATPGR